MRGLGVAAGVETLRVCARIGSPGQRSGLLMAKRDFALGSDSSSSRFVTPVEPGHAAKGGKNGFENSQRQELCVSPSAFCEGLMVLWEANCVCPAGFISTLITVILISASPVNWTCAESSVTACEPRIRSLQTPSPVETPLAQREEAENPQTRTSPPSL